MRPDHAAAAVNHPNRAPQQPLPNVAHRRPRHRCKQVRCQLQVAGKRDMGRNSHRNVEQSRGNRMSNRHGHACPHSGLFIRVNYFDALLLFVKINYRVKEVIHYVMLLQ